MHEHIISHSADREVFIELRGGGGGWGMSCEGLVVRNLSSVVPEGARSKWIMTDEVNIPRLTKC